MVLEQYCEARRFKSGGTRGATHPSATGRCPPCTICKTAVDPRCSRPSVLRTTDTGIRNRDSHLVDGSGMCDVDRVADAAIRCRVATAITPSGTYVGSATPCSVAEGVARNIPSLRQ